MLPTYKEDLKVSRMRHAIKREVDKLKAKGVSDNDIIFWLETSVNKEVGLENYFDSKTELAEFVGLPQSKFHIIWM